MSQSINLNLIKFFCIILAGMEFIIIQCKIIFEKMDSTKMSKVMLTTAFDSALT